MHFVRFDYSGFRLEFSLAPIANMTVYTTAGKWAEAPAPTPSESNTKKNENKQTDKTNTLWRMASLCDRIPYIAIGRTGETWKINRNQRNIEEVRSEWDFQLPFWYRGRNAGKTVVIKCFYRSRCILCVACRFWAQNQVFYVFYFFLLLFSSEY